MSKKLHNILIININQSLIFRCYLVGGIGGAGFISLIMPIHALLKFILIIFLLAWSARAWRLHGRRNSPGAIRALQFDARNRCYVRLYDDNQWQESSVLSTWVHPFMTLVVVKLADQGRSKLLLVLPDAVDRQLFTRLRARLNPALYRG